MVIKIMAVLGLTLVLVSAEEQSPSEKNPCRRTLGGVCDDMNWPCCSPMKCSANGQPIGVCYNVDDGDNDDDGDDDDKDDKKIKDGDKNDKEDKGNSKDDGKTDVKEKKKKAKKNSDKNKN